MKKRFWVVLSVVLACVCLSVGGCNTIRGMGKDIEKGGEAIQRTAEK